MENPICGNCGRTATGHASIDDVRYCHGGSVRMPPQSSHRGAPTCYMLASWAKTDTALRNLVWGFNK